MPTDTTLPHLKIYEPREHRTHGKVHTVDVEGVDPKRPKEWTTIDLTDAEWQRYGAYEASEKLRVLQAEIRKRLKSGASLVIM